MTRFTKLKTFLAKNKAECREADRRALTMAATVAVVALCCMPELAMAAPWDGAANKVLSILNSGIARTIAIIAVMALGFSAYFGKLSWDWAYKIIIGLVCTFGAASIVDFISSAVS